MSVSTISQSNALGADVLLMIFHQLEGGDLLNCEAVCRQWRDILLAGTPWRRLFHRNIPCSPLWRKVQQKLEKNQLTLRTEQYREVCKAILQVERNWRTGQFKKSVYSVNDDSAVQITISDDYVAWDLNRNENGERFRGCTFLDLSQISHPGLQCCSCSVEPLRPFARDLARVIVSTPSYCLPSSC